MRPGGASLFSRRNVFEKEWSTYSGTGRRKEEDAEMMSRAGYRIAEHLHCRFLLELLSDSQLRRTALSSGAMLKDPWSTLHDLA